MTIFTPDQINEAVSHINSELGEISQQFCVKAWVQQILGEVVIIRITSPWEVTRFNANLLVDLMVYVNYEDADTFNIEKSNTSKDVKYRMIKGKTPLAAAEKLVTWVRKNIDLLNALAVGE